MKTSRSGLSPFDTTTCPAAVAVYREWDREVVEEIELERRLEAKLGRFMAGDESGQDLVSRLYAEGKGLEDMDLALQNQLTWIALQLYMGRNQDMQALQMSALMVMRELAERFWLEIYADLEKESREEIEQGG